MPNLVVVSGLSGSGKTHALRCLEDLGYLCVDNLPAALIPRFAELVLRSERDGERGAALALDVREGRFLPQLVPTLRDLRANPGLAVTVLFFEASDEVLLRRFSESRRPHPLSTETPTLAEAIQEERRLLAGLEAASDVIVDTSALTVHDLRRRLQQDFGTGEARSMRTQVMSFGFKHGLPPEADMVFDARFLPNPFFVAELRGLDGRTAPVQEYLAQAADYPTFREHLERLFAFLMPRYQDEGRAYLTLAIGCTGGRHRSVALAERMAEYLARAGYAVSVSHRDVDKE